MPIKPMLANSVSIEDVERRCKGFVMEPKLDGVRCIVDATQHPVEIYTRTGKDLSKKVPHLVEVFQDEETILDGELCWTRADGTVDFNQTMRIVGSGVDEAIRKQDEVGNLDFVMFDMLWDQIQGSMMRWRYEDRRNLMLADAGYYVDTSPYVHNLRTMRLPVPSITLYETWVAKGYEGAMLKNPNGLYVPGKRPANNWYKLKKWETIDVIITGYQEGLGKYAGMVGAIEFSFWEPKSRTRYYAGKCSGIDDSLRAAMSTNWDTYIGKVMEVKHFGKVGRGTEGYRHPQFVRMRLDKEPSECVAPS